MVSLWRMIVGLLSALTRASSADTSSGTDTEFTAEIVRIAEILPHPNADRLEIARFELKRSGLSAYEVVIQKGTYLAGDLAAYFSVDCLLPTSHPDFAFLKQRMDGAGKELFRLRAARLRGVFSQGLLVPAPSDTAFGDGVAEKFGVTYHRGVEDSTPGGPTPPSSRKRAQPWPVYGVESLKKVPRLFELGEEVVVTEKIHGCNFRFGWVRRRFMGIPCGWKFLVGSHRAMKGEGTTGYYGDDVWAEYAKRERLAEKTRNYPGFLFVGELYGRTYSGKAIQDMTYGRSDPGLAMFDVRDPKGCWLSRDGRAFVLADCGLPEVPTLYRGPFEYETVTLAEGMTVATNLMCSPHIREGIVIESVDRSRKGKYVSTQYLLRKEAA